MESLSVSRTLLPARDVPTLRATSFSQPSLQSHAESSARSMSRYNGRASAKAVEKDYPHFVDIAVPLGGLGTRLNEMYAFHTRLGIASKRGHGRHDANGAVIRWCFADEVSAAAFAKEFVESPAS